MRISHVEEEGIVSRFFNFKNQDGQTLILYYDDLFPDPGAEIIMRVSMDYAEIEMVADKALAKEIGEALIKWANTGHIVEPDYVDPTPFTKKKGEEVC